MTYLPDDILYTVCTQVWDLRDFDTLFNCACSGRQLAAIAVKQLYRMHDVAPVTNGGRDENTLAHNKMGRMNHAMRMSQEQRVFKKWAGLWRTIILSSLGKTLYPYCQNLRTLNLYDLEKLITNDLFKDRTRKDFFRAELAQFNVYARATNGSHQLDRVDIINRIGAVITKRTPLLEVLTGKVSSYALSGWIPQLPRLTYLKLCLGTGISGNGTLIRLHCPSFKGLDILEGEGQTSDRSLVAFLNELTPQSLESFETFDYCYIRPETFQALNCHGESLIKLKLNILSTDTFSKISLLKGCTNLVSLSLGGGQLLEDLVVLEIVAWLKELKKLKVLAFDCSFIAPAFLSPIFLDDSICLTSFKYDCLAKGDTKTFNEALANQTSLKSLWLKGDLDESREEVDILVDCLSELVNLTDLNLGEVSEMFMDLDIVQLASSLPKLEVWSMSGYGLPNFIWGPLASLRSLRRLELCALTGFTADDILGFIEKLGPSNKGIFLSVKNGEMDNNLSYMEQEFIHEMIAKKVDGTFKYELFEGFVASSLEDEDGSD